MQWNRKEKYLYLGTAVFLCVFLVVGLLSLMSGIEKKERKKATPQGAATEEEKEPEEGKDPKVIRVVLKTNGFKKMEHQKVTLEAKSGLTLSYGDQKKECKAGEKISIQMDDEMFQEGSIIVEPKKEGEKIAIPSLKRGYGIPSYRGTMKLYSAKKGVVLVNELPLEEYLYAVVPSEMPASYEIEALKAQAVCARSYAVKQSKEYSYAEYQAHVDDSVSFQVYGNSKEQKRAMQAVDETAGEKVWHDGKVATTYYFSTSCGKTTSAEAWGSKPSKSNAYLKSVELKGKDGDYEKNLPWYQWKAKIPGETLKQLICKNTKKDIGELKNVEVTKRGPGGISLQIKVTGSKGNVIVDTENKIRRALGGNEYIIQKNDGKTVKGSELLPSAFFTVKKEKQDYVIQGGGYGHGIGMSQNGANEMAKAGKNYKEILTTFYQGIEVRE